MTGATYLKRSSVYVRLSMAAIAAVTCVFAYAAFQKAGINPADWNGCLLALGVIIAVYGAFARHTEFKQSDRITAVCLICVLAVAALQVVPFPVGMVRMLSPMRVELYDAAARITGDHAKFVTLSATPYATAQYLLTLASYAVLFLFIRHIRLQLPSAGWVVIWPLLIVCMLDAIIGCFQVMNGAADGARGTYVSKDHFAGLLETALPFALIYPFAVVKRGRQWLSPARVALLFCAGIAAFALLLTGVILSRSRMGFVASLAAIFAVLATAIATWNSAGGSRWPKWIAVLALAGVMLLALVYLPTDALVARFADLPDKEGVTTNVRVHIWRESLALVRDYPLFGSGLGSYAASFLRYKVVAPMYTVDFAHNDYLQVLAELGMLGFAAGITLVIRVMRGVIRAVRRTGSGDERYIAIGCLGAMTAMLLHSFVDFNSYVPANGLEFAWVLGIAASYTTSKTIRKIETLPDSSHFAECELIASAS